MRHVHSSGRLALILGLAGFVGIVSGRTASLADEPAASKRDVASDTNEKRAERGRKLFAKRFKELDEMCSTGDGLGPVFNARSCAECHGMVGPGGAGGNDHNVELLTVSPPSIPKYERAGFVKRIAAIDPVLDAGFASIRRST